MTKPKDKELMAIAAVERALAPLDMAQRDRVLAWANARFGMNLAQIVSDLEQQREADVDPRR